MVREGLVLGIVVATLALILLHPRGLSEAWAAAGGAAAMALVGGIGLGDVRSVLAETANVLLFLLGMMVLTDLAERAGVFAWLAEGAARLARGSGLLLFANVFLLGALVTAFLSLDVTVITLTPIVFALTGRRKLDPLPFVFACTFVANTASLVFPISNLTNLLVYSQLNLGFFAFAGRMWLPDLVAVAANAGIFLLLFRRRLPRRFGAPAGAMPAPDWWFRTAAAVLGATLVGLLALGLVGRPLAWAALAGAGALLVVGLASGRARARRVVREVSWSLFVFVVGMFLVVRGLERAWIARLVLRLPHGAGPALVLSVVGNALGSNVVNNVPMTLLSLTVMRHAAVGPGPGREALAYGTLLGANIGPTLTTYGSLATMLWLGIVRKRGLAVTTGLYLRVAAVTMPVVLLAATLALWLTLTVR